MTDFAKKSDSIGWHDTSALMQKHR